MTREWQFTVGTYTVDSVGEYVGVLQGAAQYTADAGGHSGAAGDYAMDFGPRQAGQSVHIPDASFINEAAATDQMAVAGWQKLHSLANSGFFWATSPSSNGGQRGWGTFPWGNNNIYFDTAGCCDGLTQRISSPLDVFPGYTGDVGWWTNWHHFVYQKNGTIKEIWIDGQLLIQGESINPLPTDFTEAYIGFDVPDNARLQGIVDDLAVFATSLDEATIGQLASGTLPSALPAATELLAYWDFNDASNGSTGTPPPLSVSRTGTQITLTYEGTLESAETIDGTWSAVPNADNPFNVTTTEGHRFYRARGNEL